MKKLSRLIGIILVIVLCTSIAASAATNKPMASNYLAQYDAYIVNNGGGSISIWFDVSATGTMDQIGALTIILREYNGTSWNTVRTYSYTDLLYSHILATNTFYYMDNVSYSAISGRAYYASVTVWAGKDGGGDSRVVTTSSVVA